MAHSTTKRLDSRPDAYAGAVGWFQDQPDWWHDRLQRMVAHRILVAHREISRIANAVEQRQRAYELGR